jgi:hypothetical protein
MPLPPSWAFNDARPHGEIRDVFSQGAQLDRSTTREGNNEKFLPSPALEDAARGKPAAVSFG